MNYRLDTTAAKQADTVFSAIKETGKYVGMLTRAEALTSDRGTRGLGLSFKTASGQTADYLDIWTHKSDGEALPGAKVVSAILACLKLREIREASITVEKWNQDAGRRENVEVPGYPDLMGKRIGFLLQQRLETNNKTGADVERVGIYAVFDAETERTASEILDQKNAPERLPKMLDALLARPIRDDRKKGSRPLTHAEMKQGGARPATGATSFDDMDDDIPFANPYKGRACYVV